MKRLSIILAVFALAMRVEAQTRPTTMEIRRGIEIPATEPAERAEAILEQIVRKIEPDLKGDASRLPVYVDFWKRESVRDPRLFAVDVSAKVSDDGRIVLNGFVEYPQHTLSLQLLLRKLGFEKLRSEIAVVSDAPASVELGVVSSAIAFVADRIDAPRENLTEILYGEPVFVLRRVDSEHLWIHGSDGYVGYVNAQDVKIVDRGTFTEYMKSAQCVLRRACKTAVGNLPAGARLMRLKENNAQIECQTFAGPQFRIPRSVVRETDEMATMQQIEGAVLAARKLIGTPYVWGGRTAEGIDCSGLTQMAYASQGINLPRDADQQAYVGRMVATSWYRDAMSRGDLMFFISRRGTIAHVAIYLGDNQFIEAADAGVNISSLDPKDKNYQIKRDRSFAFARRVLE